MFAPTLPMALQLITQACMEKLSQIKIVNSVDFRVLITKKFQFVQKIPFHSAILQFFEFFEFSPELDKNGVYI